MVSLLAVVFGAGAGCATVPVGRPISVIDNKLYVILEGPPNLEAEVMVNGEPRGPTPLHLRLDADEVGNLAYDVEVVAQWTDGRNDTSFVLRRGTRPSAVLRLSTTGIIAP